MKLLLTFFLFAVTISTYSQNKDTTFNYDLNFDRVEEKISCSYSEAAQEFTLRINNESVSGTFYDASMYVVEVIDINRNDNLKEVIVKGYGNSDQLDMFFYQYIDGKIIPCGHLPSNYGIETTGNGKITEDAWMGFWSAKFKYDFDTKNKTITKIDEEFYEVKQECEVKNPFKLLVKRDDNSDVAVTLTPKTKLTIIKADISPKCNYANGEVDDFTCDWYYFVTPEGKQGWCRLRDFQENVDGLLWAG
jgi:hypothetical protein